MKVVSSAAKAQKRIYELESMILELLADYQCAAACAEREGYETNYIPLSQKADKLLEKRVSL